MKIETTFWADNYDKVLVFCYGNKAISFHGIDFEVSHNRVYGKTLLGRWRIKQC